MTDGGHSVPLPESVPFIVVEVPANGLPGTVLTQDHSGVTVDIISEPWFEREGEAFRPMFFMVRGADRRGLEEWLDRMAQRSTPLTMLHRDALRRLWIGHGTIRQGDIDSAGVQRVFQFQDRFGAPWLHAEGGVFHLRAALNDAVDAEVLVAQMRADLVSANIEGQVELQEFSLHDYSVWDELVQYRLGLSPMNSKFSRTTS